MSTSPNRSVVHLESSKLFPVLQKLGQLGVKELSFRKILEDPEFAQQAADFFFENTIDLYPIDQKLAKMMPSQNFFGFTDWFRHYGLEFGEHLVGNTRDTDWIQSYKLGFEKKMLRSYRSSISVNLYQLRRILSEVFASDFSDDNSHFDFVKDEHFLFCLPDVWITESFNEYLIHIFGIGDSNCTRSTKRFPFKQFERQVKSLAANGPVNKVRWFLMLKRPESPLRVISKGREGIELCVPEGYRAPRFCEVLPVFFLMLKKKLGFLGQFSEIMTINEKDGLIGLRSFNDSELTIQHYTKSFPSNLSSHFFKELELRKM